MAMRLNDLLSPYLFSLRRARKYPLHSFGAHVTAPRSTAGQKLERRSLERRSRLRKQAYIVATMTQHQDHATLAGKT